jgi:hypothetical protein
MTDKDTVIAVMSDLHVGSTVAVAPPKWNRGEGGTHKPSPAQMILYREWLKSAKVVKDCRTEGRGKKRLILVLNGEPIEGDHHDSAQLITKDTKEQINMSISLIDVWMQEAEYEDKRGDRMYLVRGSGAHEKGNYIEDIGRDLDGVVPVRKDSSSTTRDGKYAHEKLLRFVNGVLFDIAHHGFRRGYRAWTSSRSIRYALESMYWNCLNNDLDIPDYVIRSHLHHFTEAYFSEKKKPLMHGCITPGWKLKDHFINRVGSNNPLNTIGIVYYDVLASGASRRFTEFIEVEDLEPQEF